MPITEKGVRQSVTLPARVVRRVKSLAKTEGLERQPRYC